MLNKFRHFKDRQKERQAKKERKKVKETKKKSVNIDE